MGKSVIPLGLGLALSFISCTLPHGSNRGMEPLDAVSFGLVSGLHRENARTGIHLAAFNAGSSNWGTYASARFDGIAGFDLVNGDSKDNGNDTENLRRDNYQGAFVYNMGLLFRPSNRLALYLGGGIGNFYDRRIENRDGRDTAILTTLYWEGNVQSGIIWMLTPNGGLDFGYETFDESWHLAVVSNW